MSLTLALCFGFVVGWYSAGSVYCKLRALLFTPTEEFFKNYTLVPYIVKLELTHILHISDVCALPYERDEYGQNKTEIDSRKM